MHSKKFNAKTIKIYVAFKLQPLCNVIYICKSFGEFLLSPKLYHVDKLQLEQRSVSAPRITQTFSVMLF